MSNKKSYTYCELKTCPKDPSIQVLIRSFTKDDLFETAFFIGKTQVELHPFFINLNESVEYVTNFYINFLSTLIEDDLSVVAVYNNKIIGFIGGNDYCDKGKENNAELLNEKFSRLYNDWSSIFLVEETMEEFKTPNEFGETALISALVVDKEFNGKGIGTLLFDFINYHPKALKYQIYLTKIAAYASKIISQKIGFVTLKTVKYEEFKTINGVYPFKDIVEKLQKKGLGPENNFYSFSILKR